MGGAEQLKTNKYKISMFLALCRHEEPQALEISCGSVG